MNVNRTIVAYPTVRSEIRTFNMQGNQQRYECNNLFQGRIPNRVIMGLVLSEAFNGNVARDPFCFQKFGLSNIRQLVRGEEYPYETFDMTHDNVAKVWEAISDSSRPQEVLADTKIYGQKSWLGLQKKECNLLVFNNTANICLNNPVLSNTQSGELRLVFNFNANPGASITVILQGEFENVF